MGILETIKKAFSMMPSLAGSVGALALTVVILATVVGVFVYQVLTAGSINIDGTYNATSGVGTGSAGMIGSTPSNFTSVIDAVWGAVTSVTGFIVLGVIALIAIGILGRKVLGGVGRS